ncbi:non-heme iron oxygenase ferredoxin subunit [Nocardioides caldifontis]|uniref:non-heme iron oxygenase ferredoxin subunit n=1 Tax=Nocardioides caldifontis TaxID=2588938 RepID=UPI0011DF6CFD|nr:non-heme iron oxygenase ferredoxin subunit [Nocardioides caldifontis]
MTFTRACGVADLEDGKPLAATVDGVDVALVRDEGTVYAIRDRCSHAEIPLSEGDVDGCLIECWLHGSAFDMRDGEPTSLPAFEPVAVYPVRIDGDDVLVDVANPTNNVTD